MPGVLVVIWVGGRIVPDEDLRIDARDRTFEHGLGLFETLRTWGGHPTLLDRHFARITRSSRELGLTIDPRSLPDPAAVEQLIRAEGMEGDALLRVTATGGFDEAPSVVWMRATALPPEDASSGWVVDGYWSVAEDDPLARHKTLNYWRRRLAREQALARNADEALGRSRDGSLWEGSRTNLFLAFGNTLSTPRGDGPLLPGIMREVVIERADRLGWGCGRARSHSRPCKMASEAFLTNSVRGIVPLRRIRSRSFDAPGAVTARLADDVRAWLHRGGIDG